jgi:hypothetical protein
MRKQYKLIKKCEIDFWGISYLRPRQTKFFIYLKKCIIFYRIGANILYFFSLTKKYFRQL